MSSRTLARIKDLQGLPGNSQCTDCASDDVSWAVLNHGFFVCVNCAGIHRGLGVQYSQVRSTELDVDCWDDQMLNTFRKKGNTKARKLFEAKVPSWFLSPRECPNSKVRKHWIECKYMTQKFTGENAKPTKQLMPEPAMIGFLHKCNDAGKWQKRYCVLFRDQLMYFKESSTSLPNGKIDLQQAVVSIPDRVPGEGKSSKTPPFARFKFNIKSGGRTYTLAPETADKVFEWIHAIRKQAIFFGDSKNQLRSLPKVNESKKTYGDVAQKIQNEGMLTKQGGSFMSWRDRWCVLSGHTLYYFKSKGPPKPADPCAGSIPLALCDVLDASGKINKPNPFCLVTTTRMFFFQASNSADKDKWMDILGKSVKHMINEIGREVDFDANLKK
mmetsp:Transcript_30918/g.75405  ORF Transcript_30918/g.75405 Transcript_30918/m.75405 type:complete len:385 (-) Transcript_30918:308-1462(-)|eukprot:CAMPEP_0114489148 /NCGR_PEP_ID=MMETSP0109-20121206/1724_1 /TAXON_ID=29199 /ORGANISM="Chlorarachnion reptans, Strain CCCM449" /LENGTH=384 /DNA_ID=CAMNT_0001665619 /DNA_START=455 /DNA_END=1609 /DNA_ORIENTATION=+